MNNLTMPNVSELANIEQLTKFVLVGREKLASVRAEIRAIDKLELAGEVREQKREEATMLAGALLDAEVRIGQLTSEIPKAKNQYAIDSGVESKMNNPIVRQLGQKNIERFQQMAEHQDIVEQVKAEAKENDDLPTRTEVLRRIKENNKIIIKEKKISDFEKEAVNFRNEDIKIYHSKFQDLSIDDNSVDLILTDPPYPEDFLPLWEDMFLMADRVLKPSRFLIAYANHQNLDRIFRLKNSLKYYWTFKLDFTLKPIAMGRNLIATWKPVLLYQKLPFKKVDETIEDVVKELRPFSNSERDMHDDNWGQSIGKIEYLMDKFSIPGELVFEPFAGTGTTLIAARNLKRKCIGAEIEEKYIDLIKGRLASEI